MKAIKNIIEDIIKLNGGILELDTFMALVTKAYYENLSSIRKDFITAPEISQLFGESIALRLLSYMNKLPNVKDFVIIELGPGNGTLMADILRTFSYFPQEYKRIRKVIMVEMSKSLALIQKKKLGKFQAIPGLAAPSLNAGIIPYVYEQENQNESNQLWCKTLSDASKAIKALAENCQVLIISNEFFDALPIKQFIWDKQECSQIALNANLELVKIPSYKNILLPWLSEKMQDGVYEFSSVAFQICDEIAQLLKLYGGLALIIDYGYSKSINTSSLQAVYNQESLRNIMLKLGDKLDLGLIDISALVNFPALQYRLTKHNLMSKLHTQREFLLSCGIQLRAQQLKYSIRLRYENNKDEENGLKHQDNIISMQTELFSIEQQLSRLTQDMGELFKVLEVSLVI